jgi:hypothetical protein
MVSRPEDWDFAISGPDGDLTPAKGIINGAIYSTPIWIFIAALIDIFA